MTSKTSFLNFTTLTCELPRKEDALLVIEYIVGEMNTNANSPDARRMREWNTFDYHRCIADYAKLPFWKQLLGLGYTPEQCMKMQMTFRQAAILSWAEKVRQNGPWDHKPTIRRRFNSGNPTGEQVWHQLGAFEIYYDCWSNIHYGYVGKACAFSDSDLLDGAGLEQAGSDLFRGRRPRRYSEDSGLRAFDDPSDQEGIMIGMRLFQSSGGQVTVAKVRSAVEFAVHLTRRLVPGRRRNPT